MRCSVPVALGALVMATALRAADDPPGKAETPPTPRQQYEALAEEFSKAQQACYAAMREAKTDEERTKIFEEKYPDRVKYVGRFLKLAEENPKDPAAIDALGWIVQHGQTGTGNEPDAPYNRALDLLARDYIDHPKVGPIVPSLSYDGSSRAEKVLRAILEKNRSRDVRGQACLALGQSKARQAEVLRMIETRPDLLPRVEEAYGKEGLARLRGQGPDGIAKEAEAFFERAAGEFGDVKEGSRTVGEQAKSELFEIRTLAVGKPAPAIEGKDLDGKPMTLADFKGKVVLLDFWGDW
jgi:hypothetical protein